MTKIKRLFITVIKVIITDKNLKIIYNFHKIHIRIIYHIKAIICGNSTKFYLSVISYNYWQHYNNYNFQKIHNLWQSYKNNHCNKSHNLWQFKNYLSWNIKVIITDIITITYNCHKIHNFGQMYKNYLSLTRKPKFLWKYKKLFISVIKITIFGNNNFE